MQQTENYKLNLIETSDPFSPAPLNENTKKTEAALTQSAETAADLQSRVSVLETNHVQMAVGAYAGSGDTRVFKLSFTPQAVFILRLENNLKWRGTALTPGYDNGDVINIVDGGFQVQGFTNSLRFNFSYIAFG